MARPLRHRWLLGLVLAAVVLAAGWPGLDSPWIQGDEQIFIVKNPDVTGAGRDEPFWQRCLGIFTHTHEDLYQPLTILTYAIEWRLYGDQRVRWMRLTDVLLQALNGVLVWLVLARLLRDQAGLDADLAAVLAWSLALLWVVHPAFVTTWAADMGRTHLLATAFLMLSLLAQLRAIEHRSAAWSAAAVALFLLAMLNKAHVAWVAVIFTLDALRLGWRAALRQGRLWAAVAIAMALAWITYRTTEKTLLFESDPMPVFGDPVARAALAWWLHIQHLLLPDGQIAIWYPPDIHTNWLNPRVWLGLLLFGVTVAAAAIAWRSVRHRLAAFGLIWVIALWLPLSGLLAFRVHAVHDRYFYLPAVGLLLALGTVITNQLRRAQNPRGIVVGLAAVSVLLAAAAIPFDMRLAEEHRSTLARAARVLRLHPDDPRVMEVLAAAYDFGRDHPTPESLPLEDWLAGMRNAIEQAVRLAEAHPEYFPTPHARAAFYRRLSYALWRIAEHRRSLELARKAQQIEPDSPLTWLRLAHGYRALGDYAQARAAYEKLESLLPESDPQTGLRLVEFGDLLLRHLGDVQAARQRFERALERRDLTPEARRVALLGLARCELLARRFERTEVLAREALDLKPDDAEAAGIIGICLLARGDWQRAYALYGRLCEAYPTNYEFLRGFATACTHLRRFDDMAAAWRLAASLRPDDPLYAAFAAWAAACAGAGDADTLAAKVLEHDPHHRVARMARLLAAVRRGQPAAALDQLTQALRSPPLPAARIFDRTAWVLDAWYEAGQLDAGGEIIRAAVWLASRDPQRGRTLLSQLSESPQTADLIRRVRTLFSPTTRPATQP